MYKLMDYNYKTPKEITKYENRDDLIQCEMFHWKEKMEILKTLETKTTSDYKGTFGLQLINEL